MFVRDGRPRRVVQCRSHPGFPLCKHNYWVASLKNSFNIETGISSIPDIKLIRTDTTLDLSQKAEKGMPHCYERGRIYNMDFIISAIPVYGLNVFELRLLLLRSLYVYRIDCGGP